VTSNVANVPAKKALLIQLWQENPIFRQVLGICSALAVTNLAFNTLLMCLGLIWATTMTNVTVSALRNWTPKRVRMMFTVLVIAAYVIVVDILMKVFFPEIHRDIRAYVGLIVTNCIVMGRAEAFASKNRVWPSFCDGLGAGLGYSAVLMTVAVIREILGQGSLFRGSALMIQFAGPEAWAPYSWTIMILPPGAFFVLAVVVWAVRAWAIRREERAAAAKPAPAAGGAK